MTQLNKIWEFFTSVGLTIALTVTVCVITAFGSLKVKQDPDFYSAIDTHVLVPWLFNEGTSQLDYTLWMFLLIASIFVFALNIMACTAKRTYSVIKNKKHWTFILPQVIHAGFFIALIGHLLGSTLGFRSYNNVIYSHEGTPVPYNENLFVRFDGVDIEYGPSGEPTSLEARLTLSDDKGDFLSKEVSLNDPLMYEGMVFYYVNHSASPRGMNLVVITEEGKENFTTPFFTSITTKDGLTYNMNHIYPTLAYDEEGKPYSQTTDEYLNPYQEITSSTGKKGLLNLTKTGTTTEIDGKTFILESFDQVEYGVFNINKDPGISFIVVGSIILVLGTGLLLLFRRNRAELLSEPAFNKAPDFNKEASSVDA